jgi:hypothetical protein
MTHEFEELALDGHNYPTWAMDVKISLALRGVYESILPPEERTVPLLNPFKYNDLYIIRNYFHIDLKSEYVMEEESNVLWAALQTRYEQQKAVILLKENYDRTMLRLQDFKSIGEYNHAVHKICARLEFCEKEHSKADKIEKTLQTMLPSDMILQYQYRAKNYQTYLDLVHDLLQAEKHDELTLRNHHQCTIGGAPLQEVHYNVKSNEKGDGSINQHKEFGKFKKGKHNSKNIKNMAKCQRKDKSKAFTCHKYGGPNHFVRKCWTPKHLVELYQKSLKESNNNKRSYEAHINDMTKEASTLGTIPSNPKMSKLTDTDDMDIENMIVECNFNDAFEDPK